MLVVDTNILSFSHDIFTIYKRSPPHNPEGC